MTHIMLDLETWGNRPGMDLCSIGACVFDPETGFVATRNSGGTFYVAVDNPIINTCDYCGDGKYTGLPGDACENCMNTGFYHGEPEYKYNLQRDPGTVAWWNEPEQAEATKAFADPVDLMDGLVLFTKWFLSMGCTHIWGHGAH